MDDQSGRTAKLRKLMILAYFQALSQFLGSKKFLHGDSITITDCCAFAHLCQILFIPINHPHKQFIDDECSNLSSYVERIKIELWPDWEEVLGKVSW